MAAASAGSIAAAVRAPGATWPGRGSSGCRRRLSERSPWRLRKGVRRSGKVLPAGRMHQRGARNQRAGKHARVTIGNTASYTIGTVLPCHRYRGAERRRRISPQHAERSTGAMERKQTALATAVAFALALAPGAVLAADYDHVHITITAPSPAMGVDWYSEHMGCEPVADRDDAAICDGVELVFVPQPTSRRQPGHGGEPPRLLVPGPGPPGWPSSKRSACAGPASACSASRTGRPCGTSPDCSRSRSSSTPGARGSSLWKTPSGSASTTSISARPTRKRRWPGTATCWAASRQRSGTGWTAWSSATSCSWFLHIRKARRRPTTQGRAIDHLGIHVVPDLDAEAPRLRAQRRALPGGAGRTGERPHGGAAGLHQRPGQRADSHGGDRLRGRRQRAGRRYPRQRRAGAVRRPADVLGRARPAGHLDG